MNVPQIGQLYSGSVKKDATLAGHSNYKRSQQEDECFWRKTNDQNRKHVMYLPTYTSSRTYFSCKNPENQFEKIRPIWPPRSR
jgi:hypothetical protein